MKLSHLLMSVVFLCSTYSCSTTNTAEKKETEVPELKAKIEDLNNRIFVLSEQLESLKARFKDDQPPVMQAIKAKAKPVKEIVVTETPLEKMTAKKGISAEEEIVASFKGTPAGKPALVSVTAESTAGESSDFADDDMYTEYSSAFQLFKDKEYSKALVAFSAFTDKYPNTILTDHAYFWLGESYYQQSEYTLAIDQYLKVLTKFPEGSKAPGAMFRIAMSYKMLGEKKDWASYLDGLISKYPNSRAGLDAVRIRGKQ
ncbi:MAG: tol-pal system protein YbgF [bacterium]